jgi:hypothetical protein
MMKNPIPQHLSTEEWVRLPKPGERYEGLSRTTILELHEQGDIKIAAIRKPGSQKAIRLVNVPSLKAYLETCVEEPVVKPCPGTATSRRPPCSNARTPSVEQADVKP